MNQIDVSPEGVEARRERLREYAVKETARRALLSSAKADIALNIRTPEEVLALIDELNTALTQLKEGNFRCGGYCYAITVALHQVADACKQVTNTEDTV